MQVKLVFEAQKNKIPSSFEEGKGLRFFPDRFLCADDTRDPIHGDDPQPIAEDKRWIHKPVIKSGWKADPK